MRWIEVAPKGERTGLVLNSAAAFGREPSTEYPVGFSCADLPGTVEQLRAAGLSVTDPVTEPWGTYVRITDPEARQLLVTDHG
jgi:lactoylglutathione lyase